MQTLTALASQANADPNYLASLRPAPCVGLESPSKSGGKFWIGTAQPNALTVCWGKVRTAGTFKHFPLSECIGNNPVLELQERMSAKIAKGYFIKPSETQLP
jgi:predicted DNA-binding WGR domain protein